MKRKCLVMMSLLTMMMCSCDANKDSSSSEQLKDLTPIIENYDGDVENILQPTKINSYVDENGNLNIRHRSYTISNIERIYESMTYDDTHHLDIPNLYIRKVYSSFNGKLYEKIPGSITFHENGYFAIASSDLIGDNYHFQDGIICNYVYCNQEVQLLKNKDVLLNLDWGLMEIYFDILENDNGIVLHTQYEYEKDGNHYVIGSKLLNQKVNTNSKAVQYVNQNSSFAIPLGCSIENVVNINEFENLDKDLDPCYPSTSIKVKNYTYDFTDFISGFFVDEYFSEGKVSTNDTEINWALDDRASKITLRGESKEDNICGVYTTMSLEEAKNHLIQQGFKYKELKQEKKEISYHLFSMDNVMICIGKENENQDLLTIVVYIDLFEYLTIHNYC